MISSSNHRDVRVRATLPFACFVATLHVQVGCASAGAAVVSLILRTIGTRWVIYRQRYRAGPKERRCSTSSCHSFVQFFHGDCLPGDGQRGKNIGMRFEDVFECLVLQDDVEEDEIIMAEASTAAGETCEFQSSAAARASDAHFLGADKAHADNPVTRKNMQQSSEVFHAESYRVPFRHIMIVHVESRRAVCQTFR